MNMTLDSAVNLPTIITILVAIVGVVTWLIRMEGRVNNADSKAEDAAKQVGAMEALVLLHKEQFHAYQLEAAEKYMTQAAFGEIKREIVSEINRMESRLEAQIAKANPGQRAAGP
jgi:hypothetical protein